MKLRLAATTALIVLTALGTMTAAKPTVGGGGASAQGKPGPTPPPPPPPPTNCTGAPGIFPAMAYTKDVMGKSRGKITALSTDLFIANSTGSCSLKIANEVWLSNVNYRQVGSEGRIVYEHGNGISMVKFHVTGGAVVEALPLVPTSVYEVTAPSAGIHNFILSKDAQTIFAAYERLIGTDWIDSLRTIDISVCSSNCTPQILYTFGAPYSFGSMAINDTDDRLYLNINDRFQSISNATLSFLQKTAGVWSTTPRHIMNNSEVAITTEIYASTAYGKYDYNNDSVVDDVLAVKIESPSGFTFSLYDVTNCATVGAETCLSSGEATLVASGIHGDTPSFRPSDLIIKNGGVNVVDLNTLIQTQVLPPVDSVDSAE